MIDEAPASATEEVSLDVDAAGVASICIHRPPHNFFDAKLLQALADECDRAQQASARVILLSSEGKNFCAGAQFSGDSADEADANLYEHGLRLFAQPLPIVAAIQGAAIGGGLGLALAADLRIATPAARFAANFARLGFHHGFGLTVTLPAVVGEHRALDLLYTGRRVKGDEAFKLGLCDRLVAEDELMSEAARYATEVAESAPLAVQSIRKTMRGDLAERVRSALAHEKSQQDQLMKTADWREGVAAVNERRRAVFVGK